MKKNAKIIRFRACNQSIMTLEWIPARDTCRAGLIFQAHVRDFCKSSSVQIIHILASRITGSTSRLERPRQTLVFSLTSTSQTESTITGRTYTSLQKSLTRNHTQVSWVTNIESLIFLVYFSRTAKYDMTHYVWTNPGLCQAFGLRTLQDTTRPRVIRFLQELCQKYKIANTYSRPSWPRKSSLATMRLQQTIQQRALKIADPKSLLPMRAHILSLGT